MSLVNSPDNGVTENVSPIKASIVISIFVGFMLLFYWALDNDPSELPSQLIDQPVPEFLVEDLLLPEIRHSKALFQGKISMLNVWASWCPSCYDEHPYWTEYAKIEGLQIIGLNYKDKKEKALNFLNTQGNPYKSILFDHDGRLGVEFGIYGAPETFLIGPDSKVRFRHVGVVTREVFSSKFEPLIEKIRQGF